jgi:sugar-specific transcriptional regulator TrmB
MNYVEDYAKRWAKLENEEFDTSSEWVKSMRGMLQSRIRNIKSKVRTIYPSVFSEPEVRNELKRLHEEFILVPADKACNNIVFVRLTISTVF